MILSFAPLALWPKANALPAELISQVLLSLHQSVGWCCLELALPVGIKVIYPNNTLYQRDLCFASTLWYVVGRTIVACGVGGDVLQTYEYFISC